MNFAAAVEALYGLNTGVIGSDDGRHERPHKPLLLLAIFDALAAGRARPDHVAWSTWLRDRFRDYFDLVRSHNDECTPENPFYYLRGPSRGGLPVTGYIHAPHRLEIVTCNRLTPPWSGSPATSSSRG